ncbi:MAG: Hsp20/alpha crystallin family protein [SAR324 cluster bacterium]|nr:Hsp20/alpha crystallin family protein [SAR324 cluster bacterium]
MWNEFDKMVNQIFTLSQQSCVNNPSATPWAYPQTAIKVDGEEVTFTAEIPGVKKEDLSLDIKSNHLHLKGSRKAKNQKEEETLLHSERAKVDFDQTYKLPFAVEATSAKASLADGVLEIKMTRAESDKPLAVEIN